MKSPTPHPEQCWLGLAEYHVPAWKVWGHRVLQAVLSLLYAYHPVELAIIASQPSPQGLSWERESSAQVHLTASWHGRAHQVKEVWPGLGANMQQVSETPSHEQCHPFPPSFQQCIGSHCGAHADAGNATRV